LDITEVGIRFLQIGVLIWLFYSRLSFGKNFDFLTLLAVFSPAILPWAMGITEINLDVGGHGKFFVLCHLFTSIVSERLD